MSISVAILLPVYNDERSLQLLLADIQQAFATDSSRIKVFVIDDGSSNWSLHTKDITYAVEVIHLVRNMGHQKAIAIGLAHIKENYTDITTVVMDSDGEDRVEDLKPLLAASKDAPTKIIFASRKKRTNKLSFKFFYTLYKMSFFLLTGKKISFGNFSVIPYPALCKLVYYSELWNNFPGTIIKSTIPYATYPSDRGNRYAGESKMNFTALVLHGLGAIAVFMEIIITRIAIVSFTFMLLSALSIVSIIVIKTATLLAIPGWASTLGSLMFIILLSSFIISLIAIFIYLSTQSQRRIIPMMHYKDYILLIETPGHA